MHFILYSKDLQVLEEFRRYLIPKSSVEGSEINVRVFMTADPEQAREFHSQSFGHRCAFFHIIDCQSSETSFSDEVYIHKQIVPNRQWFRGVFTVLVHTKHDGEKIVPRLLGKFREAECGWVITISKRSDVDRYDAASTKLVKTLLKQAIQG